MTTENECTAEGFKNLGNDAVKANKFEEAIIYYTRAVKLEPYNYILYSNRSYAFFKIQQYFLALNDAKDTIRLNSTWEKGYFRKGEIEFATENYTNAYESYEKALQLKPDDASVLAALEKTSKRIIQQKEWEKRIPWVGAGIGIVFGMAIFVADSVLTTKPTHPLLMAFLTIIISLVGYALAKYYVIYLRNSRKEVLQDVDLSNDAGVNNLKEDSIKNSSNSTNANEPEPKKTVRYTKSQARQRYKMGKL